MPLLILERVSSKRLKYMDTKAISRKTKAHTLPWQRLYESSNRSAGAQAELNQREVQSHSKNRKPLPDTTQSNVNPKLEGEGLVPSRQLRSRCLLGCYAKAQCKRPLSLPETLKRCGELILRLHEPLC